MKAIILDWSGTLVDDRASVLSSINKILAHFDHPTLSDEEFRAQFRLPYTDFYRDTLPDIPIAEIEERYLEFFPAENGIKLLAGALDFLETCNRTGRRIFALTSVPEEHFNAQAKLLGVFDFFDKAYTAAVDKTHVIHDILRENGLAPEDTAYVGDMVHDIETAKHAGVLSVAVLTGYDPPERLLAADPDIVSPDLRAFRRALEAKSPSDPDRPISTVGALIFDPSGENVLLIRTHKWSHKWGIPGGKIERGETSTEALIRETKEETALDITGIQYIFTQEAIDPPEFMRPAHFLLLNFIATATTREVVLNDEAQEFLWVPFEASLEFDLNHPTRTLIEEVIASGTSPKP